MPLKYSKYKKLKSYTTVIKSLKYLQLKKVRETP